MILVPKLSLFINLYNKRDTSKKGSKHASKQQFFNFKRK